MVSKVKLNKCMYDFMTSSFSALKNVFPYNIIMALRR